MPISADVRRKWTYHDLRTLPDDGKRHEIINGAHFVIASPGRRHQTLLGRLHLAFGNFLAQHPELGEVYLAPFDVIFSLFDVVQPDLLFVEASRLRILTEKGVRGAPSLVVEILSKGTRRHDERRKLRLYERAGVGEYWIVDPDREIVVVHQRLMRGSLARVAGLRRTEREVLTTPLLPGLALSIDELFTHTEAGDASTPPAAGPLPAA